MPCVAAGCGKGAAKGVVTAGEGGAADEGEKD